MGEQIRGLDLVGRKAQMRHGDAAGFLGVIGKVSLGEHARVLADDLDGVFVRPHRAVGAKTPELASHRSLGGRIDLRPQIQRGVGHIIHDTHREMILRCRGAEVVEDRFYHGGGEILAAQTVAPSCQDRVFGPFLEERANIPVERLAKGAGRLGPVKNAQAFHRGGKGSEEMLPRKGLVKPHFHQTDPVTQPVQVVDGFLDHVAARGHGHDDPLRFRVPHIVKKIIAPSCQVADLLHLFLDHVRDSLIEGIGGFLALEKDIRVLGRASELGVFRIHTAASELFNGFVVHQLGHILVVDELDLLDLHGGPEPVEKVEKGKAQPNAGQMGHQGQIHDFLHRGGSQKRKAAFPHRVHIGMIPENGQGMSGNRPG